MKESLEAEQAAKRVAAKEKKEKQKGAQKSDGPTQKRARGEDGADNSTKPPKRETPTRANLRRNPKSSVRTQTNRTLHRRFVNAPPKRRCAIASKSVARLNAPSLKRSKSASGAISETEPTT